jgi:hypothetical protein
VSIPSARLSEPAASPGAARRPAGFPVGDLVAIACLVVEAGIVVFFLRHLLTRPFYYDEGWRADEIAMGPSFLGQLHAAVGPLSLGWLAIENAARVLLGDTEAGLRTPMFLVFPVLGVATYLLARRWLGVAVSFCVAGLLLVNLWIINYGLQLKSYPYEALFAVVTIALYLLLRRTATNRFGSEKTQVRPSAAYSPSNWAGRQAVRRSSRYSAIVTTANSASYGYDLSCSP